MNARANVNKKTNVGPNLVSFLFQLQISVKMFNWQTRSYAAHVETGALYGKIVDLTDELIEQFMGRYGRPRMSANSSVSIPNMSKGAMVRTLRDGIDYLTTQVALDAYLQNVRDELTGEMSKALFLLTMK